MSGYTNKEMIQQINEDLKQLIKDNSKEHKELIEKIHEDEINSSSFKTKVTTIAGVIGSISAIIITVIAKVVF